MMPKERTPTTKQKDQIYDIHTKTLDNALYQIRSVKGLLRLEKKGEIPLFDPNNIKANNKPIYIADSTTFLKVAKGLEKGCISELTSDGQKEVVETILQENYISQNPLMEKQRNFLKRVDAAIERIP